jgi:uncharacterized protein (TIGR03435 family)
VSFLIRQAYGVQPWQVVDAPDWIARERYDVVAKLRDLHGLPFPAFGDTLRALLAQSFDMRGHYEQREQSTYALRVARTDGQLGPHLHRYPVDCEAYISAGPASVLAAQAPQPSDGARPCTSVYERGEIVSGGMTMAILATTVGDLVGRVVIDETGLPGYYEMTLRYPARRPSPMTPEPLAADTPSVLSALQEQLGLTLESQRRQIDVLVIDRIRRPPRR